MFAFSQLLLLGCWQGKTGLSLLFPISPMNSDNETFNLVVLLVHQNSKKKKTAVQCEHTQVEAGTQIFFFF